MGARKQVEWCMICEAAPCECKGAKKPQQKRPARINSAAPTPTPTPPVETEPPATVLRRPRTKPEPVETRSFTDIQRDTEEDDFRRAILLLRLVMGATLIEPETPEQRAAVWRARRWKERHAR